MRQQAPMAMATAVVMPPQQGGMAVAYAQTAQPMAAAAPPYAISGNPYAQTAPQMMVAPQMVAVNMMPTPVVMQGPVQAGYGGTTTTVVMQAPRGRRLKGEAWIWFVVLLIFFWPLCWLPFVMDQCYEFY